MIREEARKLLSENMIFALEAMRELQIDGWCCSVILVGTKRGAQAGFFVWREDEEENK